MLKLALCTLAVMTPGLPSAARGAMVVAIGTENPLKVAAVHETIQDYPLLKEATVRGKSIPSGVRAQPLTLEETIQGAKNRAQGAYGPGGIGIGIESGVSEIPGSDGQYTDQCVCSVYDGHHHHIGISCGFLLPRAVSTLLLEQGLDLDQALKQCGLTENPRLGTSEGAVGLFTSGRITRLDYSKQALIMALISLEKASFFPEFG